MSNAANNYRAVDLLVYRNNGYFKAHWALFIPYPGTHTVGTKIHATGSMMSGFDLTIVRSYDLTRTYASLYRVMIANVDARYITPGDIMQYTQGDIPRGRLEEVIASVPTPGRSLRSVGSRSTVRIEVRDCQWWTKQAIAALQAGIVHSSAMGITDAAPIQ